MSTATSTTSTVNCRTKYYLAKLEGDEDGAEKIDAALRDLGEELEYDDFLFDYYHGGHDDCSCLPWDDYFGPHSVFVEVNSGWIYTQRTRVEDFNDSSTNAILGVAGGLVLPAFGPSVWPGSYAFVKGSFYAPLGKTPLFGPASDYYTTLNALLLGEFGVGGLEWPNGKTWDGMCPWAALLPARPSTRPSAGTIN